MAHEIKMPQLGLTMEEGTVGEWKVKVGDHVSVGDVLMEIETDKITTQLESEFEGVLLDIVVNDGEDALVQAVLGHIGEPGEKVETAAAPAAAPTPVQEAPKAQPVAAAAPVQTPAKKPEAAKAGTTITVIGGGPGGYVAAIRASQLGAKVKLVEEDKLGGTCLNVGCIPTKVLLHYAELVGSVDELKEIGITADASKADWAAVQKKKEAVSAQLVAGVTGLMKANKIEVLKGKASFTADGKLEVKAADGKVTVVDTEKYIVATGSVPAVPPIPGLDNKNVCIDSTGALSLNAIPKKLLIIGGGVIGIEMGSIYNSFGTDVTIVEAMPQILPMMDAELTKLLSASLKKKGIKIITGGRVEKVSENAGGAVVEVTLDGKTEKFEADKVLVAIGRRANTEGLGLEKVGVETERGKVQVDGYLQTKNEKIYAIGDCLGQVMLAHTASEQGEIAAANIMGHAELYNGITSPSCIYTNPELAGVGMTEQALKEQGIAYKVGKFPLTANGKALIMNGGEGMVKVLTGAEYDEILGVHIFGPRATDLIGEAALAIGMEATAEEVIATIHAHPTLTEAVKEATLASLKRAIHIPNK